MKETRSKESVRITSCSPGLPSSTSSEAVSPRRRTAWTGTPSILAPRAPCGSDSVASGTSPRPAAPRARAMPRAVAMAVPEGASTLSGWCISTTSADSKKGAAI